MQKHKNSRRILIGFVFIVLILLNDRNNTLSHHATFYLASGSQEKKSFYLGLLENCILRTVRRRGPELKPTYSSQNSPIFSRLAAFEFSSKVNKQSLPLKMRNFKCLWSFVLLSQDQRPETLYYVEVYQKMISPNNL